MNTTTFDLIVIGAGPGGYVCALRAAKLGLKTALIEKEKSLGGTCLNVGCIPSKALLHSTELLMEMQSHGEENGILDLNYRVDLEKILARKEKVVQQLTGGIAQLCQGNKIERYQGQASFQDSESIELKNDEGSQILKAKDIVIATGSASAELPFLPFDGNTVISSTEALSLESIPEKLVVVGAGAIGLEMGSVWARLGSEVTVVEFLPQIAPSYDTDMAKLAERHFKKQGLKLHTATKVSDLRKDGDKVYLQAEKKGKAIEFEADKILVSVGRKPYTEGLNLESIGLTLNERGFIPVDEHLKSSVSGIWAIGDVVPGPMLAHKAEEEGVAVAERIAKGFGHVNYELIPNVIYTQPELASVGLSERAAKEKGLEFKVGKFSFQANGRALASDATAGAVKVIADAQSDRLLGAQIVGKGASELIASVVAHMEYGGSAEDIGRSIHAHPTLSEAIKEAALAVNGDAIHSL